MRALPLHRALLALYPPSFRRRHGAAVLEACRRSLAEEPGAAAWARTLMDVAAACPGAWLDTATQRSTTRKREFGAMGEIMRGIRFAARRLRRSPGFTLAAAGTLALAMAVVTAVYGLVDAALLRPLPYADAGRLVSLTETLRSEEISVAWPNFEDWRGSLRTVEDLQAYRRRNLNLTGEGPAERVRGLEITAGMLSFLGVDPVLGRGFGPGADGPAAAREVLLTHHLWTERYGADPGVVGSAVYLDGEAWTVVGVMPLGFRFPDGIVLGYSDLYLPIGHSVASMENRDSHPGLYAVGRLAPDRDLPTARAELDDLSATLEARHPETNREIGIRAVMALERVVGDVRPALTLMAMAAGLVLLVACANVSGLFLAQGAARRGDDLVRVALGAGRRRIVAQLFTEAGVLAVAGGAVGLLLALVALEASRPLLASYGRLAEAGVDLRVALVALGAAPLAALLVAMLPALRAPGPGQAGRLGSRDAGGGGTRLRSALVVGQMAVALALLVAAGLLGRGFANLAAEDGGVRAAGVLTFRIGLPDTYDTEVADEAGRGSERSAAVFFESLAERAAALPGVTAVGGISTLPFSGAGSQAGTLPEGGGEGLPERVVFTDVNVVLPGYFDAMGVELLRGRDFDASDGPDAPTVVVVDERLADRFWPGEDPLGRRIQGWGLESATVVGLVNHVKNYGVASPSREELYMPHAQRPYLNMYGVIRAEVDPTSLAPAVRALVAVLDSDVPVASVAAMEDVVRGTVSEPRLAAILGGTLAALAALLAVLGLYALVAYTVATRTREIGVRMALGAGRTRVQWVVVVDGLRLAALGAVLGLALAAAGARAMAGLINGVSLDDPLTYAAAVTLLLLVAAAACWLPARRAAGVEPTEALRASA